MIAWVTGTRSAKTFKKLYEKVKHLKNCIFYTDSWDAFSKVLPKELHVIGKQYTVAIEQDNNNIRNDLARFTRRTKVVSKSEKMVNLTLKLWQAFHSSSLFSDLQGSAQNIYSNKIRKRECRFKTRVEKLGKSKFIECMNKNFENSIHSFNRSEKTLRPMM